MRFTAVLLIWLVIIGGVLLYTHLREPVTQKGDIHSSSPELEMKYRLEITPLFALEPNPFSLDLDKSGKKNIPFSLLVRLKGRVIGKVERNVRSGEDIIFNGIDRLSIGENEFLIEAYPVRSIAPARLVMRVKFSEGLKVLYDHTYWSDSGAQFVISFPVIFKGAIK